MEGFVVVKDLAIKQESRFDSFGYCLQKVMIDKSHLSAFSKSCLPEDVKFDTPLLIGAHTFKNVTVLHTRYFLWLYKTFNFQEMPNLLHAVVMDHQPYLKEQATVFLKQRYDIKEKLAIDTLT